MTYTREVHTVHVRDYRRRHPEKRNAHIAIYRAVREGRLMRESCFCGSTTVEAHHYLGYAKEHQLDVRWLCRSHHLEAHR